jgi:hypothetical protein
MIKEGAKGTKGTKGARGARGAKGIRGTRGIRGAKGIKGGSEAETENCLLIWNRSDFQSTSVSFHYLLRQTQSYSRTISAGSEEWDENFVNYLLTYTRPIVG